MGAAAGVLLLLPLAACSSDNVDCSGTTCTVTLEGDGAKASILGNDLAFVGTENGEATVSVGDASVSCSEGESVSVGGLALQCTSVTEDEVELTATLN